MLSIRTYSFFSRAYSSSLVNRLFSPIYQGRVSLRVEPLVGIRGRGTGRAGTGTVITLESAVSRILSPMVDMATEERVSKVPVNQHLTATTGSARH